MADSGSSRSADVPPSTGGSSIGSVLHELDPAYFGFVMSTGIVSIAFHGLGIDIIAVPLAVFNVACFLLLLGLFGVRTMLFPGYLHTDLWDSSRRWGTLTFVVGANTVGAQLVVFFDMAVAAASLWVFTVVATPLLLYYLFVTAFIGTWEEPVDDRVDGALLLSVVCMQSLSILGALISDVFATYTTKLLLVSAAYWGAGFILYLVVLTIVTYRLMAYSLSPEDWHGPYWITMGAAAITTLAGALVGPRLQTLPAWEPYAPMTISVTFLAWAAATWWIPVLLVLDVWKFTSLNVEESRPRWVVIFPWSRLGFGRRLHFYEPASWGRVFPMGMYTACTVNLAGINTFDLLAVIPRYWAWFALVVWTLTLLGTVRSVVTVLRQSRPDAGAVRST